ncbi:MAG: c-type cytochrome [Alphaproteobacteria bacterium]
MRRWSPVIVLALAVAVGALWARVATDELERLAERGRTIATLLDCATCHGAGVPDGPASASRLPAGDAVAIAVPGLGLLYPPNLTPDEATGIGAWTRAEIVTAIRMGIRPDGRPLTPTAPWHAHGGLSDDDARALAVYLRSLRPVRHRAPAAGHA